MPRQRAEDDMPVRIAANPVSLDDLAGLAVGETPQHVEYRVLTTKELFLLSRFDPVHLQKILNEEAQKGWAVNSVFTDKLLFGRNELVVILERSIR